ncbi:MAG: universal stress protein [Thermoplasmata archaeon]|jgi:nucleotide-binding universal stress UspA family protein|nr:universal stress protein [Thermoplasmata archaeon]
MTSEVDSRQAVGHILVAVDGSKESDRAVVLASQMSVALGAEMTLLHVVEVEEIPTLIAEAQDREREELGQMVLGSAVKMAGSLGVAPTTVMLNGHAAAQILRYASQHRPDLIVMGGRGLTGAKGVLMGSVSMTVSKKAECAVVIAR